MPSSTLPEGQSLYDFLSDSKPNGKNVYETSSMPQRTEDLHKTIGYPQGQLNRLEIGSTGSLQIDAITGVPEVSGPADAIVLGQKPATAGKPDLIGSPTRSTVVTAPADFLNPVSGLPDLTPSSNGTLDQIFKSSKGKG
ncbi:MULTISPECIES: hypothetical protein [unclassified Cyanobium]|uniref:hypothetical protein n=1 Tax=unclassified Cyanobium TaxID=2627006 RepID=UPI0020CC430D|nr:MULTISPECIES: hypothetical protein [unclassified Cyanobium]MCP9777828.1 hypothetical protein [Cyanobium sp. Tous-M-B4]